MHLSIVSVRFGLMLEAYCRGCGEYMKELSKELLALNKMKHLTDTLQSLGKKRTEDMLKYLKDPSFTSAMEGITSPLDHTIHLKKLKYRMCAHMSERGSCVVCVCLVHGVTAIMCDAG